MLDALTQQIDRLQHPGWRARLFDPLVDCGLRWLYPRLRSVRLEIGVPSRYPLYEEQVTRIVLVVPRSMAEWRAHRVRVLQQYRDALQSTDEEDQLMAQAALEQQWEGVCTLRRVNGLLL
jgi:hypothetical protein